MSYEICWLIQTYLIANKKYDRQISCLFEGICGQFRAKTKTWLDEVTLSELPSEAS